MVKPFSERVRPSTLVLFDVDGTLTPARREASPEVIELLAQLRDRVVIGFVGGSDLAKQQEQIGQPAGKPVIELFDFAFAENGLTAYKNAEQLASASFIGWIGEDKYKELVKFVLHYVADLNIPKKRGTFIEFRNGMVNISPIGRNASNAERDEFEQYDKQHNIRSTMVKALKQAFPNLGVTYSIGGQISFDVFPTGWDKTYCLQHVEKEGFNEIHFFGDKAYEGGNDWEIYNDPRTIGHKVTKPEDTMKILKELFF
ncbi:Phosphomannomutase 1 [Savitreella phatthalungensis]